jgi:hypothetical protein
MCGRRLIRPAGDHLLLLLQGRAVEGNLGEKGKSMEKRNTHEANEVRGLGAKISNFFLFSACCQGSKVSENRTKFISEKMVSDRGFFRLSRGMVLRRWGVAVLLIQFSNFLRYKKRKMAISFF